MKERGELPDEEGDVVKEDEAMHEDDFWSSWLREDERGKEERNEEEKGEKRKRGKEKRRKESTKRGRSKEDVRVVFLLKPLKFLVKGEFWRVVVICLGRNPWRSMRTCLIVSLVLVRMCVWCLI